MDESVGEAVAPGALSTISATRLAAVAPSRISSNSSSGRSVARSEEIQVELTPDDCSRGQHMAGRLPQPCHSRGDHVSDAVGKWQRADCSTTGPTPCPVPALDDTSLGQFSQHLADEEWVPVGLTMDGKRKILTRIVETAASHRHHGRHGRSFSSRPVRCEMFDPGLTAKRDQALREGMGSRQLGVSICRHDDKAHRIRTGDEVVAASAGSGLRPWRSSKTTVTGRISVACCRQPHHC